MELDRSAKNPKKPLAFLQKTMDTPQILSYTMRTRRGKQGGKEKTNQDSFVASCNINGKMQAHLFGVYDGHGKTKFSSRSR